MPVEPQLLDTGPAPRELRLRGEAVIHWLCKVPQDWREMSLSGPDKVHHFLTLPPVPFPSGSGAVYSHAGCEHSRSLRHDQPALGRLPRGREQQGRSRPQARRPHPLPQDPEPPPCTRHSSFFQFITRVTHTKSKLTLQMGQSIAPFSPSHPGGGKKAYL